MYALHIPAEVAKVMVTPLWNLGDLFYTDGVFELMEHEPFDLGWYLMRHLAGDYGLLYVDELDRERTANARKEGRVFTSLFDLGDEMLKVVTVPSRRRTVVCLSRED